MSLLNLPTSNCAFSLGVECLADNEKWFIDQILKRSRTMAETRKYRAGFNHRLEIVKRMKRRITSSGAVTTTTDTANTSVVVDIAKEERADKQAVEYDEGYTFERFSQYGGWLEGRVIQVLGDDLRRVNFAQGKKQEAIVTVIELARLENEPKIGEIGFQFVKIVRGGGVFNAKVERKLRNGNYFCRFEDDDTYSYLHRNSAEGAKDQKLS